MDAKTREINRIPDQDLYQLPLPELHNLIRRLETDKLALASDHARMMKDINKRMQIHLLEIRGLKEVNQRLQDDSQELRDLCVFLDDDRQKSRKLAREWQRFGRYTSSVMKSEVSAYQEKLNELEARQNELLRENIELKELCIYLDDERNGAKNLNNSADSRDQGDGSSISSLTNERTVDDVNVNAVMTSPTKEENVDDVGDEVPSPARSTINDHTTQYINQLESHIKTLEDQLTQVDIRIPSKEPSPPLVDNETAVLNSESKNSTELTENNNIKIAESGDQLEQIAESLYNDGLNDMEKTVLRQILCKMVQRKFDNEAKQRDGNADDHSPLPTDLTPPSIDCKFANMTTSDERFPPNNPSGNSTDFYQGFNPPRQVRPDVTNSYQDYGHYGSYTLPDSARHHQVPTQQQQQQREMRNGDFQRYEGQRSYESERIPYEGQSQGQFQGQGQHQGQGHQFQGQGQYRGPPPDYDRAVGYAKGHPPDYPGPRGDYRRAPDYGGRAPPPQGPPEYGRYAVQPNPYAGQGQSNSYTGPVPPNNWGYQSLERRKGPRQ